MIDPEFQEIERARERLLYESFPSPPAENFHAGASSECPNCGSSEISDRQGKVRPEGDDSPPWQLVCEDCKYEWETDE